MLTLHTGRENGYDIHVGKGLLSRVGAYMKEAGGISPAAEKVCILSDDNVFPLYGACVTASLRGAGYTSVYDYVIPHGETSKNIRTYGALLEFLAEHEFSRTDVLIALGGGVVGDLCGFAAATFLRGIAYVQLPTSLLAMVDSSVGAKTAIDLRAGKNLCGAFWRPALVLCDITALDTLPSLFFSDGMAEVIKYGVLYDKDLFDTLLADGCAFDREAVISRCIAHKIRVVEEDEFDRGARAALNFGHTAAHGIEGASGYTVPHGHAVAIGMAIITRAAVCRGLCEKDTAEALHAMLARFDLDTVTSYPPEVLWETVVRDKKRSGGKITWVIPRKIGQCELISYTLDESLALLLQGYGIEG